MVQTWQGNAASLPLYHASLAATARTRGTDSYHYGQAQKDLARTLASNQVHEFNEALQYAKACVKLYTDRYGFEDEKTKEAELMVEQISKAAIMKERYESSRVARMAKLLVSIHPALFSINV